MGLAMPIYHYKHPETGEIHEDLRASDNCKDPLVLDDGTECEFVPWYLLPEEREGVRKHSKGLVDKNCEVWEKDPDYVKKAAPKYVRRRDGVREKYDPTRHR